jgi:hypothetical protein
MPIPSQTIFQAMITEQTCGDACWHAKEDICRCSCGGKNHGCLRTEDGQQPARTRKIKGAMYQLAAVQTHGDDGQNLFDLQRKIENTGMTQGLFTHGDLYWAEGYRMEHLPVFIKTASEGEVKRWPELSAWRDVPFADVWNRPQTLWIRIDFIQLVPKDI